MVPRCFRPILMATSGFSTACFLPWWLDLSGCSHWAGMAELQLRSKSWVVLLQRSHRGLAHLVVSISCQSPNLPRRNFICSHDLFSSAEFLKFFCTATCPTGSPSIKVNVGTLHPSPSPASTEGPVLVETKLSKNLHQLQIHQYALIKN